MNEIAHIEYEDVYCSECGDTIQEGEQVGTYESMGEYYTLCEGCKE